MEQKELNDIIEKHILWLKCEGVGLRANLSNANLSNANLRYANLRYANLSNANLRYANLRYANLSNADLSDADLSNADLICANLICANLSNANLSNANLRYANLSNANLSNANLSDAVLPHFQIPQTGALHGFKKLSDGSVIELKIPAGVARTATLIGRKCRCAGARVMTAPNIDNTTGPTKFGVPYSHGSYVVPDKYDPDPRVECTHGIHFFLTREEAEKW